MTYRCIYLSTNCCTQAKDYRSVLQKILIFAQLFNTNLQPLCKLFDFISTLIFFLLKFLKLLLFFTAIELFCLTHHGSCLELMHFQIGSFECTAGVSRSPILQDIQVCILTCKFNVVALQSLSYLRKMLVNIRNNVSLCQNSRWL